MQEKLYEKTLKRAFNLLSAKPRSIAELRERLLEKDWAVEEIVARVLTRLQELNYLNDEQFAAQYAHSRLTIKAVGRNRLRRDLQRKNLSSTVINQALEDVYTEHDEEALITKAITKRLRLKGKPTSREETKKLFDHLVRLGFNFDLVIKKVRAVGQVNDEDEEQ